MTIGEGPPTLFRLQLQRGRIDAVAQAGRAGAVLEDMAEMAVALRAQHLGADHAVGDVALLFDMAFECWLGKARPAAAGIEFGIGFEQRLAAAGAGIGALALLMLVLAGERPLGRLLAQHRVLHRRQFLTPLGFALLDLGGRGSGVGHKISHGLVVIASHRVGAKRRPMTGSAKQSILQRKKEWIAWSRSLSSGPPKRDPLAPRNDGDYRLNWWLSRCSP